MGNDGRVQGRMETAAPQTGSVVFYMKGRAIRALSSLIPKAFPHSIGTRLQHHLLYKCIYTTYRHCTQSSQMSVCVCIWGKKSVSEVDLCVGMTVFGREGEEGKEKVNEPVEGKHTWG